MTHTITAAEYRKITMNQVHSPLKAKCVQCGEIVCSARLEWIHGVYYAKLNCGECGNVEWCVLK